jgi:hypothetical protein
MQRFVVARFRTQSNADGYLLFYSALNSVVANFWWYLMAMYNLSVKIAGNRATS